MKHNLPASLPVEWIASKQIPDQEGCYRSWFVVRHVGGHDPYAVHLACWRDNKEEWMYGCGEYYQSLADAMKSFVKR